MMVSTPRLPRFACTQPSFDDLFHIWGWRVVTISITAEALAAIEATLPDGREAERRPDGKGGYFITLPHGVVDRLKAMRGPGATAMRS
jgi:hypothetical protein